MSNHVSALQEKELDVYPSRVQMPRSNIFMVYNSVENKVKQPYSGQKPRPEYIATRDSL
jgi:hypothetical protein